MKAQRLIATVTLSLGIACGGSQPAPGMGPTVAPMATPDAAPPDATPLPPIAELTPAFLRGVYLGMTRAQFVAARPAAVELPNYPNSFDPPRFTYEEDFADGPVQSVLVHMFRSGEEQLYKLDITYRDANDAHAAFDEVYTPLGTLSTSTPPDVWIEHPAYPFPVKVWALGHLHLLAKS